MEFKKSGCKIFLKNYILIKKNCAHYEKMIQEEINIRDKPEQDNLICLKSALSMFNPRQKQSSKDES